MSTGQLALRAKCRLTLPSKTALRGERLFRYS